MTGLKDWGGGGRVEVGGGKRVWLMKGRVGWEEIGRGWVEGRGGG